MQQKEKLFRKKKVPDCFISKRLQKKFCFKWINDCDAKQVLQIRNAEHVLQNMRSNIPISIQKHKEFVLNYEKIERIDFIICDTEANCLVGCINIAKTKYGLELGKYIGNVNYLGAGLAVEISNCFLNFLDSELVGKFKLCAVTKKNNFKNINLNFQLGFKIKHEVEDFFWIMER